MGRNPTVDEKAFMDKVCSLGCIVCLIFNDVHTQPSPHHIDGKTKPGAHFKILGLCGRHHQIPDTEKPPRWEARHPNKTAFEAKYGTEQELYFKVLELIGEEARANTQH